CEKRSLNSASTIPPMKTRSAILMLSEAKSSFSIPAIVPSLCRAMSSASASESPSRRINKVMRRNGSPCAIGRDSPAKIKAAPRRTQYSVYFEPGADESPARDRGLDSHPEQRSSAPARVFRWCRLPLGRGGRRLNGRRRLGERRQRRHDPLRRKGDDDFRSDPQFGFQREGAAVQVDEILDDRQSETGALLRRLDGIRALPERGKHNRDFLLRNAGASVLAAQILAAGRGPADLEPNLAAGRRELDGVGKQVETDLADCTLIGPQPRQLRF